MTAISLSEPMTTVTGELFSDTICVFFLTGYNVSRIRVVAS
jgi:hypothetical protein